MRQGWFSLVAGGALTLVLLFLTLPVISVFTSTSPRELLLGLDDPVARDALMLSLRTSAAAMAIIVVFGTPTAYLLATRRFRGRELAITLIELPLVLPPAVAGIALLAAFGPSGIFGSGGLPLSLQTAGVVVALTFVASPFYIRQAQAGFEAIEPQLLEASRTLGASQARTFLRVAVPCAAPALTTGFALALGRALGEFGATLMFAGSFRGVTQTVPLAIYDRFASDFDAALALSAVLVAVSAAILLTTRLLGGRHASR
jgi:molybdate transport system permease protein